MKFVIFDFDGTLTERDQNVWKDLWKLLGYPTDKNSPYAELYVSHVYKREISRQEWFDLTAEYFIAKGFDVTHLINVAKQIKPIDGLEETLNCLKAEGYQIHILSGGFRECIRYTLKDLIKYFDHIECNKCLFNEQGKFSRFIPTSYDYEGKLRYVEEIKNCGVEAKDIIFIGNGDNDEWVIQSGCKTLFINPTSTDGNDRTHWHSSIQNVTDLTQILPYVLEKDSNRFEL